MLSVHAVRDTDVSTTWRDIVLAGWGAGEPPRRNAADFDRALP